MGGPGLPELDESVALVGAGETGVTVIVPVKGIGRAESGERVYVTVNGAYGSDVWESAPDD